MFPNDNIKKKEHEKLENDQGLKEKLETMSKGISDASVD